MSSGNERLEPLGEKRLVIGLLLVSTATLAYELVQIRIFAYSLHPIIAFSAIALAMLGFGLGGTVLALRPAWSRGGSGRAMGSLSLALGASMIAVMALFSRTSERIVDLEAMRADPLWAAAVLLPSVIPYFLAGAITTSVFDAGVRRIGRLYFWNLLGSAAGCAGMILLLRPLGADRLAIATAALAAAAGCVFAWSRGGALRWISAAAAAAFLAATPFEADLFPLVSDPTGFNSVFERWERRQGWAPAEREISEWDPVGRLEVRRHEREHISVSEDVRYRVLTVDGGAMTLLLEGRGRRPGTWGRSLFADSIYGAAYHLVEDPSVLVIGVGGGTDVEAALHWGARRVVGVEISASTLGVVGGRYADFAGWPGRDEVTLVHADGRSFAKSTSDRFDVVQLSGVDTVTAHASGAMVTVEDYLYTVEAFTDFIEILEPGGVLSVVRFGDEAMNLSMIAVRALRGLGVEDPQSCVAALRQAKLSGVLVKREPFTARDRYDLAAFESREASNPVEIPHYDMQGIRLGAPVRLLHPPGSRPAPRYRAFFHGVALGEEEAVFRRLAKAAFVPTDDRPYYMMGMWAGIMRAKARAHPTVQLLFASTLVIAAASLVLILLPVLSLRRRSGAGLRAMLPVSLYFFALGACYMLLEVGLIHRATVFVGTPGASVAVVLAAMLVSSGAGARVSELAPWSSVRRLVTALIGLAAVAAAYELGAGPMFEALFGLPVWARCVAAAVAIAPAGFFMGWFFPTGLRVVGDRSRALVTWAVAVNGFASVLGSLATFFLGVALGFRGVFLVALVGYALAVAVYVPLARRDAAEEGR